MEQQQKSETETVVENAIRMAWRAGYSTGCSPCHSPDADLDELRNKDCAFITEKIRKHLRPDDVTS